MLSIKRLLEEEDDDDGDNEEKNIIELINLGISMGIIHVLTGPDHISALASLSANVSSCEAFGLGIRWGMGHSVGLILVASILIGISEGGDIEESSKISHLMEFFVGIFMILLGFYGVYGVCYTNAIENNHHHLDIIHDDDEEGYTVNDSKIISANRSVNETDNNDIVTPYTQYHDNNYGNNEEEEGSNNIMASKNTTTTFASIHNSTPKWYRTLVKSPHITKLWAFLIGIIHGVTGPGGVLGVIPAVQLHNIGLSSLYLGTFCISSVITMGLFAMSYGTCTNYISNKFGMHFSIQLFSALLCIVVGVIWCLLILTGNMDNIFPD